MFTREQFLDAAQWRERAAWAADVDQEQRVLMRMHAEMLKQAAAQCAVLDKLRQMEAEPAEAPIYFDHDRASGWASGFNAAIDELTRLEREAGLR